MQKSLISTSAILAAALASPTAAMAQAMAGPQSPPAATAGDTHDGELADIIVTASRRSETLQKTAIPVSVISGDELTRKGVTQAQDLNKAATGLSLSPNGANTQVYLRGIGTFSISAFSDSAVAFNDDGVFLVYPGMISGNFFDLQRVEVLKGPQGTLYGRNATAGAINLITNRPSLSGLEANASIDGGSYGLFRVEAAVNAPVSDTLAVRAAGQIVSRGGYFSDGSGDDKSQSVRLQTLYKPSSIFSLLIKGEYSHIGGRGTPNVVLGSDATSDRYLGPSTTLANQQLILANQFGSGRGTAPLPPYGPGANFPLISNDSRQRSNLYGVQSEANIDLGVATLTQILAYRREKVSSIVEPGFHFFGDGDGDQTSYEARLASPSTNRLKWLLGGYVLGNSIDTNLQVDQGVALQTQVIHQDGKTYAGFAEASFAIIPVLRVTGGARYTEETKNQSGTGVLTQRVAPLGPFLPPLPLPPFAQNTVYPVTGNLKNNNVSGRVGVEFDASPRNLLYATFSTGFKAGGFNPDVAPNVYRPEKLTAYTIGAKNRFFGNKLQFNVEGFYWNYRDHQENVLAPVNANPQAFAPFTRNIGKSTIKGGNVELQWLATPNDLFTAQIEYLKATFDQFSYDIASQAAPLPGFQTTCAVTTPSPAGVGQTRVDCSGKPFTRAPEWTALVAYQHIFPLGGGAQIVAGADVKVMSSFFIATDYIANERQKSSAVANANLGYEAPNGRWSLTAYARNLGNVAVATGGFEHPFIPGLVYGTIGAPRTFGAILKFKY
jgi:iron complex outermembrane receptor protein